MTRNCKIARLPLASPSATQPAPPKWRAGPGPPLLAQPPAGSPSHEKQQRIRQVLGVGPEYGPAAAPESLLPPKPEPN